jgi:hypothetical protein
MLHHAERTPVQTKLILPVLLTIFVQRFLGMPGLPGWSADIVLPMVWVVAAALMRSERRWPLEALILGLVWDAVLEPVIGPGGIAWSATALTANGFASLVADRSAKAWAGLGGLGVVVMVLTREIALLPLGFDFSLALPHCLRTVVLTSAWCGLVGLAIKLDIPRRFRTLRARRLR